VSARLGIPTISTGAIIREAIKNSTEMGQKAKNYIDSGALVPDDVVIGIVKERLAESDCKNGFILDGFPRTVPQAIALDNMGVTLSAVVSLEVSDETIVERMSGRRVCAKCGKSFHAKYKPSKNGEYCECGEKLTVRSDDAPEVVRSRLAVYHDSTEPLKAYYESKGLLRTVIGQEFVEDTTAKTLEALGI
jgi:adenylate kinase